MSQTFERTIDRKDAIIRSLAMDIEEAEEQYQVALRKHLQNMDDLIGEEGGREWGERERKWENHTVYFNHPAFQTKRIKDLEDEYQQKLAMLRKEFDAER